MQIENNPIIKLIAKFGIIQEKHLDNLLIPKDEQKKIIKELIRNNLIIEHKLYSREDAYYTLSNLAAQIAATRELKKVPLNKLSHDMSLIDLYFHFLAKYPTSEILSERELSLGDGVRVGDKKKVPDLLIVNDNNEQIVLELEVSQKSHIRLIEIISNYVSDIKLTEVLYFVYSKSLGLKLLDLAGNSPKVRVFLLDNSNGVTYTELSNKKDIFSLENTKSPWSFDLDYYLNNPEKYKKT